MALLGTLPHHIASVHGDSFFVQPHATSKVGFAPLPAAPTSPKASLALKGMWPFGSLYEQLRADVIAGRVSFEQAVAEISASFGPHTQMKKLEKP